MHSAALSVGDKMPFPLVDLQVDWDDIDTVGAPRRPGRDCARQMTDYLNRALYAEAALSYGVVGDLWRLEPVAQPVDQTRQHRVTALNLRDLNIFVGLMALHH